MGFLFKKKEVPEELPNLAFEEINKNLDISQDQLPQLPKLENKYKSLPTQDLKNISQNKLPSSEEEGGYFKELIKSITEENQDVDKLDSWYKNQFMPGDVVFQMREYWEKQQPEILLKNISGELKNRILEQSDKLHTIEKEWQEIYFTLLSKEEEIRKEEKELKNSISEFISLYKRSSGSSSLTKGKAKKG